VVKLGPAFGASILGSVLNDTYQSHLSVAGLPSSAASTAQSSVFGALAIAREVGSPALADSARAAFVAGMDDATRVAAAIALVAFAGALVLLPRRAPAPSDSAPADSIEPVSGAPAVQASAAEASVLHG
jgi:hypothetical protein